MGVGREEVLGAELNEGTSRLVDTYHAASSSPLAGVAAIHAYERQVPAVARAKIDGLREHYGIEDGVTFWEVHERLDVEHAEAERAILAEVGADGPEAAIVATREALDAWWGFLDAVDVA